MISFTIVSNPLSVSGSSVLQLTFSSIQHFIEVILGYLHICFLLYRRPDFIHAIKYLFPDLSYLTNCYNKDSYFILTPRTPLLATSEK